MLNLQLPLPLTLNSGGKRDTGEMICRGLMHVISSLPLERDPSHRLLNPDARAAHTVRQLAVPIGDHTTPGYLFTPKQATGATVLLVHGTTAEKVLSYYFFIKGMLNAGIQVMTFEMDGHGENPRPLCDSGLAENVPAAVRFLKEQPEVDPTRLGMMGVSLGGACALNAAPRIEGLKAVAAVSTPHTVKMDDMAKVMEALTTLNVESLGACFEATPNTLLKFVLNPMRVAPALDMIHEELDLIHPKTLTTINQVVRHLNPLDNAAELKHTPVLVVNGDWDNITPAWQARDIYEKAAGPKALTIVPRRNHFTIMTSPVAVNSVVNWFRRYV